jgi:hypothetical protein
MLHERRCRTAPRTQADRPWLPMLPTRNQACGEPCGEPELGIGRVQVGQNEVESSCRQVTSQTRRREVGLVRLGGVGSALGAEALSTGIVSRNLAMNASLALNSDVPSEGCGASSSALMIHGTRVARVEPHGVTGCVGVDGHHGERDGDPPSASLRDIARKNIRRPGVKPPQS